MPNSFKPTHYFTLKYHGVIGMVKLFGSSGVRGLINIDLTPNLACKVACAAATHANAKKVVVAKDTRVSGNMLEDALISGAISCGADVFLSEMVPTPVLAYTSKALGTDVGFMLTASHNPAPYNGIKVFKQDLSFIDNDQEAVEKIIENCSYKRVDWRNIGKIFHVDTAKIYLDMIMRVVKLKKPWNVVIDSGCGAAFDIAPRMFKSLGCKVTSLNSQPDGHFPARKSEPTAESLRDLAKAVKILGADIGIGFDGDADRVAFVDENGVFLNFDRALAAFSAFALKRNGGGTIITTIEASMCVETMAEKYGGKVVRTKVGDVYISEAIKREGAVFGGEPCGAWVHPEQHLCPDGPLSAAFFMAAVQNEGKTVSEIIENVPEYPNQRVNFTCKKELKYPLIEKLNKLLKIAFPDFKDYSSLDGVRIALENGWFLVRASGTEPLIRLTVEGKTMKAAKDITQKATAIIQKQVEAN
jgi:phosphoglucosamine mutase